jgi:hypothetical protein
VHIVDDAHLAIPQVLAAAEHATTPTKLLLSAHTAIDDHVALPGTIHLDSKRAVQVIAASLRSKRSDTLAAVRQIDDRVGDAPADESLEQRLEQAEQANLPWQFCFILSGGWRRVSSIVASARAVRADIALAAIAIRQLASRDALATEADLAPLFASTGMNAAEVKRAANWLVGQRIVNSLDDLRCPHQRFAAASFNPILDGQTDEMRHSISKVIGEVLIDHSLPLSGLTLFLTEWRMAGQYGRWKALVPEAALEAFLTRCWGAERPEDIRAACHAFRGLEVYRPDWMKHVSKAHVQTLARWFSHPLPGAGYAIGSLINGTYQHRRLGRAIVRASDPEAIAQHLNAAAPLFACEIAEMVKTSGGQISADWRRRYFNRVDKTQCFSLVTNWPSDAPLSAVADYCNHFVQLDQDFGFDLIEALADRISDRARENPAGTFGDLSDIFWFSLRVYDPLQMYTGKKKPTPRMLEVSAKLCGAWVAEELAAKLSESPLRQFQNAAGLLSVLRKSLPEVFEQTVATLDWNKINSAIGDLWSKLPHDAEVFFGQCYANRKARQAISELIDSHVQELATITPRIALLAPDAARQIVSNGGSIPIAGDWVSGAGVLADFATDSPQLLPALLIPHEKAIAAKLSQVSPTFYDKALPFLRIYRQLAPESFSNMLANVDCSKAEAGWASALAGGGQTPKNRRSAARKVIAWLIYHSKERSDALGNLSRDLAARFANSSIPDPRSLKPVG